MRKLYSLLTFILLTTLIMGNNKGNQTISGTVVDKTTGFPLIGAYVILLESNPIRGTTTDVNGNFEIRDIALGRQGIQITYLGYKPNTLNNLLLTSGKQLMLNIRLEEDVTAVDEVVVKANGDKLSPLNKMATVSARSFSVEETERFAGSLGDPARMVANYAGVATGNDSRNDIIIRGNSPSGLLWRIEGIEIPNPNHFAFSGTTGGPVSMINNNLLTNSDFFTGAFPAEYGNALAGAFDLHMRSGNPRKTEFTGQIGFNGFEAGLEGPMFSTSKGQKASYLANYRYSTLGLMNDIGFSFGTGDAVPQYQDLTFIADIPGTKAGRFKIFGLYGDSFISMGRVATDTTETSYNPRGTATDYGSGLWVIGASHTYFFNANVKLKTTISYQQTHANTVIDSIFQENATPQIRQNQHENKISIAPKLTYKINRKNNINVGIIADYFYVDYVDSIFSSDYDRFMTGNDIQGNLGMLQTFAQWQHKFNNSVTAYAGIHSQYFDLNNETAVEPRLGMSWQANPKHSFNAGFGMHSQTQPKTIYFSEVYDEVNDVSFTTNEDLKFTKSNHYIVGHNYLINQNFRIKSEAYYQNIYNAPVAESFPEYSLLNGGADFGGYRVDSMVNEGTGTNYGLEITLEKFLSNGYYLLFTTSLFESKYKGYDGVERNTAFNGNYVFNLLTGYEHKINEKFMLTFDLRTVLAGGKRYVPIDFEESEEEGKPVYDWSRAYEDKFEDYFRADLRIGFKHNGEKFSQEWGVDLQNITNYKSIFSQGYDAQKNETYYTYQQGFMPMVLYRIQF